MAPLDEDDRKFLRSLAAGEAASVEHLCETFGVTATAVRQRLERFRACGYVTRVSVKQGRGRPRYDYAVTGAGRRALNENYEELAAVLWEACRDEPDPDVRRRMFGRITETLAKRYGEGVEGVLPAERFEQLGGVLRRFGFDVEVVHGESGPALREISCPYHDIAAADTSLCELERQVFEKIVGTELVLKNCCMDGEGCCEFVPVEVALTTGGA